MMGAKRQKPTLTFWQIWNMSFGFLGIQFGFALQNANVSRIFETLGAKVENISILWLAAPITGLVAQPIIGYFSDRTWTRIGRRRPFFLAGAVLASIALVIIPNSPLLWVAAGMLWIMDTSFNISMEPFRAFVGDNLPDEQRTKGFAMQSFFIGTGSVVASLLPFILTNWFGVSNHAPEGIVPNSVKWSFYLGAGVFILAVLWTVLRSFEYSPEELAAFTEEEKGEKDFSKLKSKEDFYQNGAKHLMTGIITLVIGLGISYWFYSQNLDKQLYVLSFGITIAGVLMLIAGFLQRNGRYSNGFVTMINDFQFMPKTMAQLAAVQFFSWFALFSMWIYTTPAVTSHVFGTTDTSSELFNEGANWVGVLFAVYNGVAAAVAFLLPVIAKKTNRKTTHAISLVLGAIGLISIFFITGPKLLILSMVGIGFAWASILSMPYAILTGALPSDKMGYYMGVFNFFIVIPQIVAAAILGFFIARFFGGEAIYAMFIGGASFMIAAVLTLFVDDERGK